MLDALTKQIGGDHYTSMEIQPAEYILANTLGHYESTALEYISRWKEKGGVDSLKKAQHALQILIDFHIGQATAPQPNTHEAAVDAARYAELKATKNAELEQIERHTLRA